MKDIEKKIILVTGGAGYVGSILVKRLIYEGFRVVCVDNLRFGGSSRIGVWGHPDFRFVKEDISNFKRMDEIIDGESIHCIVHLAAIVGDPACKLEPNLAKMINRDASAYLLEKALKVGIPRFIFASTCSNYGKMEGSDGYVDENSPLTPVSLYAELKVEFEDLLLNKTKKCVNFSPTALRFATVYGLSPRMRFDLTVNEFTKELALQRELIVFGEQFWRPYCHVKDFSEAIIAVLKAPSEEVAYNVYNVGDNRQNYTKKMIVEELLRQIPDAKIEYVVKKEDPRDYRVNFDKITNGLRFSITKTVPQGISEILECLKFRIIDDPDDQRYYNIPVNK